MKLQYTIWIGSANGRRWKGYAVVGPFNTAEEAIKDAAKHYAHLLKPGKNRLRVDIEPDTTENALIQKLDLVTI